MPCGMANSSSPQSTDKLLSALQRQDTQVKSPSRYTAPPRLACRSLGV